MVRLTRDAVTVENDLAFGKVQRALQDDLAWPAYSPQCLGLGQRVEEMLALPRIGHRCRGSQRLGIHGISP
jgi:hypothetical protein